MCQSHQIHQEQPIIRSHEAAHPKFAPNCVDEALLNLTVVTLLTLLIKFTIFSLGRVSQITLDQANSLTYM